MFAAALFGVSDRVRQSPETHKPKNDASVRKKSAELKSGAGLEVVAALREELLPGDALLVAHSPRA